MILARIGLNAQDISRKVVEEVARLGVAPVQPVPPVPPVAPDPDDEAARRAS